MKSSDKKDFHYWWNNRQGTSCPWLVPMGNGFWPIPFTIGLLVALSMKGKYDTTVAILIAGVLELGMDFFFEIERFRSILSKS